MRDGYGNIVLSRYFLSNCLVEAVKAKAKEKSVRIHYHHVKGQILPHFYWTKSDGYIYEFGTNHKIICPIIFSGYLRKRPLSEVEHE